MLIIIISRLLLVKKTYQKLDLYFTLSFQCAVKFFEFCFSIRIQFAKLDKLFLFFSFFLQQQILPRGNGLDSAYAVE